MDQSNPAVQTQRRPRVSRLVAIRTPPRREDRKIAILLRAEELFANFGYHGVSIRDIALAAAVPPALVLYHFQSKELLYQSVFEHRAKTLNEVREARIAPLLARNAKPEVREVLDALVRPWIELRYAPGGISYARLIAREVSDPSEESRGIISKTLDPIARRFLQVLIGAVPELRATQVHWAYHFLIASLVWLMANTGRIQRLSGARCAVDNPEVVVREIVEFFATALHGLSVPRLSGDTRAKRQRRVEPLDTRRGNGAMRKSAGKNTKRRLSGSKGSG